MNRLIVSLFDHTGTWSQPYADAGYRVERIDIQDGRDVLDLRPSDFEDVHGVLNAMPCTHFASSGARWFAAKDADGRTDEMVALLRHSLDLIDAWQPSWWVLENPIGRIARFDARLGAPLLRFNPCDYGDPYTKRTCLYGRFNPRLPRAPVAPIVVTTPSGATGSWLWATLGGASERTKRLRSATPPGFARAFFEANP